VLLCDASLAKLQENELVIAPIGEDAIQPSSIDVRLGDNLRIFHEGGDGIIDPTRRQDLTVAKRIPEQGFIMEPGEFVLGETVESVRVPADYAVQFTGKSSLGRLGLQVHMTAGHIDPGFEGIITLEIHNVTAKPWRLYRDMWIGQLLFFKLDSPAERPYGCEGRNSRYFGQSGVTESRSWM